jgi:hypothetical protein
VTSTLVKGTNLVSRAAHFFLMFLIPCLAIPGDISYVLNVIRDAKHGNIESGPHLVIQVLLLTAWSIMPIFFLLILLPSVAQLESEHRSMARIIMIN